MRINNSIGKIWYGIHFYPGLAQYQDGPDQEPYRVYLNENTLRSMDPTFAGRPIFVDHVDEVEPNLDELRKESDGWVVESFFNSADGKHWVKFITVSDLAERAIKNGFRLSNAYMPKKFGSSGVWNGIPYAKEVLEADYDHLAIVKDPRYEESEIYTPEQFKKYNEDKLAELKKISNSKDKGEKTMGKFSFFKRQKVENSLDLEGTSVVLPKTKKEFTIEQMINAMDEVEEKKKDMNNGLADMDHKVKMKDGSYCNVSELLEKHNAMSDEMEKMKKDSAEKEKDLSTSDSSVDVEGDLHNEEEESVQENAEDSSEDQDAKKKALQLAEHEEKEIVEAKKKNAKEKAERIRNANKRHDEEVQRNEFFEQRGFDVELSSDRLARGRDRY